MKQRPLIIKLTLTGMMLALSVVLPALTFNMELGQALSPMHIPALLCGLICGPSYGLFCGLLSPLMSLLFNGRPPMIPVGLPMMFELGTYGLVGGLLRNIKIRRPLNYITALVIAMIAGRIAGIAAYALYSLAGVLPGGKMLTVLLADYFVKTWPGIAIQIILIPAILFALRQAKLIPIEKQPGK